VANQLSTAWSELDHFGLTILMLLP
jgi:hypothetical protein